MSALAGQSLSLKPQFVLGGRIDLSYPTIGSHINGKRGSNLALVASELLIM